MLLNSSTVQTKGLQFNHLAVLIIKSYPQYVDLKFSISFLTTNCFGLLNPCINYYGTRNEAQGRCTPQLPKGYHASMYISESQVRDCCYVLTYLDHSLSGLSYCQFAISTTVAGSTFQVDHTEFTATQKMSCCDHVSLTAALHINTNVKLYKDGCFRSLPEIKNRTFQATYLHVEVRKSIAKDIDGCSSIFAFESDESRLCLDLELSQNDTVRLSFFGFSLSLFHPCINTGMYQKKSQKSIQFKYYGKQVDMQLEYYFKQLNGSLQIRKGTSVNKINQYNWELLLPRLHSEIYQFIDSRKTGHGLIEYLAEVRLWWSFKFVLEFRMKKAHPINSDTFFATPLMRSSPCPGSSYSLLSRCYRKVATGTYSWLEASQACEGRSMNMLSLNSEQEWLALADFLFQDEHFEGATVFLGLQRGRVSAGISSQDRIRYSQHNCGVCTV